MDEIRILVWNEGVHEQRRDPPQIATVYPDGIHGAIAAGLSADLPGARIRTAILADPEHGLGADALRDTDVLLWWGHLAHDEVDDEVVERVRDAVHGGMGLIALHSAHFAKVFTRLLGTTCSLMWRNDGEREVIWTVAPSHPIARGVPQPVVIPEQEMYGEHFDIPRPDDVVFISSFEGGEVFRSGVTFTRGLGRIFYFSPGDQDFPVYHHPDVRRILANAVQWAAQRERTARRRAPVVSNPRRDWFLDSSASAE